jgi:hypothetical protein
MYTCTRSRTCSISSTSSPPLSGSAARWRSTCSSSGSADATTGAAQLSLLRLANFYVPAVIAPAAAVVLVSGLILVTQTHAAWSASWVIWGIAGILASLVLGATLIRATNAELIQIAADTAPGTPRWLTLNRPAARLYGISLIVLLSVLRAMVFQPTL